MGGRRAVEAHAGLDAVAGVEVVGHLGEVVAGGLDGDHADAALCGGKSHKAHVAGVRKRGQAVDEPLGERLLVGADRVHSRLLEPPKRGGESGQAREVGGSRLKAVGHEGGHLLAV